VALLLASAIGILVTCGVYLLLRPRTFTIVIGLALLSYAVNLFLFAMGRVVSLQPPLISETAAGYADPLPQALVLTAIVINLGMTALLLALAVRSRVATGTDHVDGVEGRDKSGKTGVVT
jgi:multicomponent K+:H+ antiporter subunit C